MGRKPGIDGFAPSTLTRVSKEELEAVYRQKGGMKKACETFSMSAVTLYKLLAYYKIPLNYPDRGKGKSLDISIDRLTELLDKYGSCRGVERALGVGRGRVYRLAKSYGVPLRSKGPVGVVQRHLVQSWWGMLIEGKTEEVIDQMGDKLCELSERFDK